MNKIYKVIWSKVKHQYVVVSELAHSCTKSTSSRVGRSAAAVLAALVLTTGVCAVPVQAADPTLEELYYEQMNRAIQNGETSSPLVTLAEVPATTSAATEDGEPAAEEETQPGEDGSVTGTASQYTVTNKDGFYASNTKGTHNTLSKDGLWVGGKDDNTGFHVDNDGNVRTTGSVTVKSEQGDVIIQNGGVQAGNVKINTDGKNTITGLTNTTWDGTTETPDRAATEGQLGQVQGDLNELNKAAVKYDSDGQGGYTNNVTIGGQVTANSFQNTDGSFSVDANGNVDAETVKSEGMSVVDEDGNTTFQVLANGDVTAHDVTATTVTGGTVIGETIRNTNNSFSVDANGNVDAETVKSEGMSVVDEDGNTTFQVLSNGDVTATTVTGGTVIGETIRNTNNSFSVDANGNVDAETVKSEGMSVVDEDGNTTFQVLSNGDVTAHAVTATTVTGGTIQNADGSFSVDANGNVDAETVKSEGMSVVDEDGNTTFQVLANGDVTAHDVTATTVTGGTVIGETIRNTNNSFSVDANGNVDAETVKSEGMSVVDEDGNTTFQVLSNGDVTAHAVTATTVTGGTIQNADGSFSVDANGNVDAETVKSEGMSVVDEDGNTTFQVLANGDVTASSYTTGDVQINTDGHNTITGLSNVEWSGNAEDIVADRAATEGQLLDVQGNLDTLAKGAVMYDVDEDGNVTDNVTIDGKMRASEFANSNNTFMVTEDGAIWASGGGNIDGVGFQDGVVTAPEGISAGYDAFKVDAQGNVSTDGTIIAQGNSMIGGVTLEDGNVLTNEVWAGNNNFHVNETGSVTAPSVTGLENTEWNADEVVADRAATEGQLLDVQGNLDTLAKGAVMYDVDEDGNVTDNVTIDGKMRASEFANSNNTFMVTEDGAIWASGGGNIDGVGFQDGVVTAPEGISAGYDAFKVDAQGNVSTDGTIIAQGNSMIGGVTLEDGNVLTNEVWAGNNNFHVNETGSVTAPSVTGLENTEWNADEVVADRAATEGQLAAVNTQVSKNSEILAEYEDAGIIAGSVDGEAEGAIAIGEGAAAINGNSIPKGAIAIGHEATVSMNGAVAIGDGANAVGQNSVALGTGASTTNGGWNSVAIGWGSQATDSNVVSVGSDEYKRRIVNVAAGENDNDAVNVGQLNSSLKSRVEYDYTTEADGTKTYKDTIGGVTLKEGEVTANTFKNSDSTFQVTEDGTIVARGGGLIDGVGFEDGKVTATDFVLSTGTQSPVNMSDMWKVMTGGTFEYGTQTYGGAYFTKTGNTSYINYGGTSNINLNNLGQVMGAVENVGVDTVTNAINDLGQGKNASGALMNEKASTENTTETAVGPASNEILAAPAANEALAAPAMARPMAISTMTNSALSAPQEAKEVTRDPIYGTGNDGAAIIDTNLTVTGDTHLKGDLEVDGEATFNDNVSIKGNLNMNNNKITGVADGAVNATSTDAVNGSQLYDVKQDVEANAKNISTLGGAVNKLGNRIDEVGAGAAALAALHPLDFDPDNKWDFSAGFGNYRGESAVAFGAFYRPNEDTMFSVGGTVGNDDNMVNAGVSLKIGSGSSSVTTSRVAMAKEIKAMRDVVAKQDAQIQKLTAMVNALVGVQTEPDTTTMFPDVPENHWAYEAVAAMARSGLVKGYPDGEFKGDRTMTRYEFAQIIQNAIQAGAEVDSRLVEEFKPELEYFHIATVAKDKDGNPTIERVRAN